jgi:hypothetical protein
MPGICGGRPGIDGHFIQVEGIATWHERILCFVSRHKKLERFLSISLRRSFGDLIESWIAIEGKRGYMVRGEADFLGVDLRVSQATGSTQIRLWETEREPTLPGQSRTVRHVGRK